MNAAELSRLETERESVVAFAVSDDELHSFAELAVGDVEGEAVRRAVGRAVGDTVGLFVGAAVGDLVTAKHDDPRCAS